MTKGYGSAVAPLPDQSEAATLGLKMLRSRATAGWLAGGLLVVASLVFLSVGQYLGGIGFLGVAAIFFVIAWSFERKLGRLETDGPA